MSSTASMLKAGRWQLKANYKRGLHGTVNKKRTLH